MNGRSAMHQAQLSVNPRRRLGDGWLRFIPWVVAVAFIIAFHTARDQGWAALASPLLCVAVIAAALIGGGILGALYGRKRN